MVVLIQAKQLSSQKKKKNSSFSSDILSCSKFNEKHSRSKAVTVCIKHMNNIP